MQSILPVSLVLLKEVSCRVEVHLFPVAVPGETCVRRSGLGFSRPLPSLRPRFICHRQRSGSRPSRTQKLSSSATTLLGGLPVAVPDIFLADGALRQLSTAATRSPRFICHRQRSARSPGKIGNANTKPHYSGSEVFLYVIATQGKDSILSLR